MRRRPLLGAVASFSLIVTVLAGCGGGTDDGADNGGDDGGDTPVPFTLNVAPEFVQGAVPGASTGVIVTISNSTATDEPVEVSASAAGAQVSVDPVAIRQGEVAEVTVIADPAAEERPLEIVVTGRRGDLEETVTKTTTVFPWEDDRRPYATTLLELFTPWLAANEPDLGITPTTEFSGSFNAPGLLVVSHYLWMSDAWEVGLSWHVMIPPDDWAEIYLRARDEPAPTRAFRLASQDAALNGGDISISEVAAPAEVVR